MVRAWAGLPSILSLAIAGSAIAQSYGPPSIAEQERVAALETDRPKWGLGDPMFGWRWVSPFRDSAGRIDIFPAPTAQGAAEGRPTRLRLVARLQERRADTPEHVSWIDGDHCPVLMDLARQFEDLRAPPTVIPGLDGPPDFPVIVLDGMHWTLWSGAGRQEGRHPAFTSMSSSSGAIAEWASASRSALSACWRSDMPRLHLQDVGNP